MAFAVASRVHITTGFGAAAPVALTLMPYLVSRVRNHVEIRA